MDKYCEICGKKVAELEAGTKIRKGTVLICRDCWEKKSRKKDVTMDGNMEYFLKMLGLNK
jgi:ribosome-binding protein aMBF1 (putative translation factor)